MALWMPYFIGGPPEPQGDTFLSCEATDFTVTCYSGPRNQIQVLTSETQLLSGQRGGPAGAQPGGLRWGGPRGQRAVARQNVGPATRGLISQEKPNMSFQIKSEF